MAHEFSFSRRQWWIAVTCSVLMVILIFAVGFVGGAMWQSARPVSAPASAAAPSPPPAAPASP